MSWFVPLSRFHCVCVLADHMCDGWPQRPQRDDEWLCNMTCPAQCLCQGHAVLCPQPFSAEAFNELRYLDASGSGMTLSDLVNNTYIVRLHLSQCSISSLPDVNFPNLQFLDVSHNNITNIKTITFFKLQNLQILVLKWNPLTSVTTYPSRLLKNLRKIDLSGTRLDVFGSSLLFYTPGIQYINISFCAKQSIGVQGFQMFPHLKILDMTGTAINGLPLTIFRGLQNMNAVYASYFKLCCKEILPEVVPLPNCFAPHHYLSSCDDMIHSEVYRMIVWFAVLANLGNCLCVVCHCVDILIHIPYRGPVVVFMTSLQCADLCMGIYAGVIAAAHETSRGRYVYFEEQWTEGVPCQVAGFLSLLSCEMSSLTIFLIVLEHLILLCFPHSTYRFSKRSAAVACGVMWLVGILLASMPLFPPLSHWGSYGQTALCNLALNGKCSSIQDVCFFHAILVFNILVCITVLFFQVMVYKATPRHRVLIEKMTNAAYASADLFMKLAVLDVARWTAVTTTSLIVLAGGAGLKMNVFMVVMVLPVNSAVNPLLCLWHAVAYRRRQKQEEHLLCFLKSRRKCVSQSKASHTNAEDRR